MALQTKTFTWGSYAYQSESRSYLLELTLTENSTDQANNQSNISYSLVLKSGSNNRFTGDIDSTVKLNGVSVATGTKHISAAYNSSWTLLSGTANVSHSADGSLNMPIEVHINTYNDYAPPDKTLNWSWALTNIPRASSFGTITGTTLGGTMRVNINRASSSFTHKVYYHRGNNVWGGYVPGTTYADVPLPIDLAELSPDSKQFDLLLLLRTYSGSTQIGADVQKYVTVTIPENEDTRPVVTMDLTPDSPFEGVYVQGLSKVQADIRAEGKLGADIKSYGLTVDGRSCGSSLVSGTLSASGEIVVAGKATDSRGITGTTEQTITVLPYYKPRLIGVKAYRVKVTEVETEDGDTQRKVEAADDGEYLKIEVTRDYAKVIGEDGEQRNFCSISYSYRQENSEKFSEPVKILEADTQSDTVETEPLLDAAFSKEYGYVVQIVAEDTAGQKEVSTVQIPCERIFRHKRAGGRGLGLGGYCEEDDLLDVHWNVRVRKRLVIGDEQVDDYVVEEGTDGDWSYRKWHSGIAECWCAKAYAGETNTTWGSLYGLVCTPPDYPDIFTETPVTVRDVAQKTGSSCWLSGWSAASITNPGIFALLRPTLAALDVTVNFFAIGKWK